MFRTRAKKCNSCDVLIGCTRYIQGQIIVSKGPVEVKLDSHYISPRLTLTVCGNGELLTQWVRQSVLFFSAFFRALLLKLCVSIVLSSPADNTIKLINTLDQNNWMRSVMLGIFLSVVLLFHCVYCEYPNTCTLSGGFLRII